MIIALIAIIAFLFAAALSWLITCGIVYFICLCFGLAFTWPIATGVWLVIWLLKSLFSHVVTVKK